MAVSAAPCDTIDFTLERTRYCLGLNMSVLSRLESRFGWLAVPNLTLILIVGQVFLYIARHFAPGAADEDVLEKVRLLPADVLAGQVWRIITFLFDPPITNPIFAFFFWYMFYFMGSTLESNWGTFRYNVFLLIGYVACLVSAFATYYAVKNAGLPAELIGDMPANNGFLYGTVFLAFARLYPEFVLYIMFVLPVKIKWLAWLQWIFYGLTFLGGDWMVKGMVVASVANYWLFFGRDIWQGAKQGHRRMQHQARTLKGQGKLIHTCAICGLSSDTSPQTQFRYCSKCDGERCYCSDHLQNHQHVSREAAGALGTESR
jgi:hypothetical protein